MSSKMGINQVYSPHKYERKTQNGGRGKGGNLCAFLLQHYMMAFHVFASFPLE